MGGLVGDGYLGGCGWGVDGWVGEFLHADVLMAHRHRLALCPTPSAHIPLCCDTTAIFPLYFQPPAQRAAAALRSCRHIQKEPQVSCGPSQTESHPRLCLTFPHTPTRAPSPSCPASLHRGPACPSGTL